MILTTSCFLHTKLIFKSLERRQWHWYIIQNLPYQPVYYPLTIFLMHILPNHFTQGHQISATSLLVVMEVSIEAIVATLQGIPQPVVAECMFNVRVQHKFGHNMSICFHCFKYDFIPLVFVNLQPYSVQGLTVRVG